MVVMITVRHKRLEQYETGSHTVGVMGGLYCGSKTQIYSGCNLIYCDDQNQSMWVDRFLPPTVEYWALVKWSEIWLTSLSFFPLFQANTHTHTRTATVRREERFGKLQNLHSSLFKQHLFSNDRSTLQGEWESIFNWMFTWGVTSTIWIRLLDHMHFCNSCGRLSFRSCS